MPWALDPQEILQIAQEAVRQRGYVTYPDYEDALRQAIMGSYCFDCILNTLVPQVGHTP